MIIGISGKSGAGKDTIGKIIQYLTFEDELGIKEYNYTNYNIFINRYNEIAYNWKIKKFAFKLKLIVSILTGIPIEDLEKEEVKNSILGEEWNIGKVFLDNKDEPINMYSLDEIMNYRVMSNSKYKAHYFRPYTVREILQLLGTNAIRNNIHINTWVNALFCDYIDKGKSINEESTTSDSGYYNKRVWQEDLPNWIITDVRFRNEVEAIEQRKGLLIRVNSNIYSKNMNHESETALDNYEFKNIIDNNGSIDELINKVKLILQLNEII